jgi:hypothetical protein
MMENRKGEYKDLKWLETTAKLLDSQFSIPGTKFKFGLDPLLGLIPVLGDASTFILSGIMIVYMARYGVSRKVLILMVLNIMLDAVVGGIPLLGNVFDFIYKANDKNMRLLREHYQENKHQGTGTWIIILILFVVFLLLGLVFMGIWKLIEYLFGFF